MTVNKSQAMALLVQILKTGGIAPAAQNLQIPKAMAVRFIQRLEASLGVKLLNRTTRHVSVTTDGTARYAHTQSQPGGAA